MTVRDLSQLTFADMLTEALMALQGRDGEYTGELSQVNEYSSKRVVIKVKDGVAILRGEWLAINDKAYQIKLRKKMVSWDSALSQEDWK